MFHHACSLQFRVFWIGGILYALVIVLRYAAGQQQRLYALTAALRLFCSQSKKALAMQ